MNGVDPAGRRGGSGNGRRNLCARHPSARGAGDEAAPGVQAHRVLVVGGGFGGLQATFELARLPVEVTLIDRRNFHLFQPLVYQVATGALSPAEIAYPLRRIFRRRRNVRVVLAEVTDVDLAGRCVHLGSVTGERVPETLPYDTLIVAAGARYNYFGHVEWMEPAENLKTLEGALTIRRRDPRRPRGRRGLEPDPQLRAWPG